MSRALCFCFLFLVLGCAAIRPAAAATSVWDGGSLVDDRWTTATNWANDLLPSNDWLADITMAGGTRLFPSVDAPWNINSLTFNNSAGAFSLAGFTLSVDRGGITNNSGFAQNVNNALDFHGPQNWNAAAGLMTFQGPITNNGRGLSVTGGFNTIIRSTLSGSGGVTRNGAGTLILGNGAADTVANTYTGLTTVNSGSLILDKAAGTVALPGDLLAVGGTVTANRAGQFSSASNVTLSGGTILFGSSNTIGSFTANSGAYNATSSLLNLTSTAQYALTTASGLTLAHFNLTGASGGGINLPS